MINRFEPVWREKTVFKWPRPCCIPATMDGLADIQHQDGASWQVRLARLRRSHRLYLFIEGGTLLVLPSTCLMNYLVVPGQQKPDQLLTPPGVDLLLVADLGPAIALVALGIYSCRRKVY